MIPEERRDKMPEMNIIVCIKQVPYDSHVKTDEKTGVLIRESARAKLNPYDLYALESAFLLREKHGGEVVTVTMGPPQAAAAIRETYYMGADRGYVFSDAKFAGADVLATSYTLSQGIRLLGRFDLIICGKQTTDGDTAQVGPALAEYLGIPHVACVIGMEANNGGILARQDLQDSIETAYMKYPCLISVERSTGTPRLPSYRRMLDMRDHPVNMLGFDDFLDGDEKKYGLSGSPTRVVKMYPPEPNKRHEIWEGDGAALAGRMKSALEGMKYL